MISYCLVKIKDIFYSPIVWIKGTRQRNHGTERTYQTITNTWSVNRNVLFFLFVFLMANKKNWCNNSSSIWYRAKCFITYLIRIHIVYANVNSKGYMSVVFSVYHLRMSVVWKFWLTMSKSHYVDSFLHFFPFVTVYFCGMNGII